MEEKAWNPPKPNQWALPCTVCEIQVASFCFASWPCFRSIYVYTRNSVLLSTLAKRSSFLHWVMVNMETFNTLKQETVCTMVDESSVTTQPTLKDVRTITEEGVEKRAAKFWLRDRPWPQALSHSCWGSLHNMASQNASLGGGATSRPHPWWISYWWLMTSDGGRVSLPWECGYHRFPTTPWRSSYPCV